VIRVGEQAGLIVVCDQAGSAPADRIAGRGVRRLAGRGGLGLWMAGLLDYAVVVAHPRVVEAIPSVASRARLTAAASSEKSAAIFVSPRTRARRPP
jgi:hypothetical protein